MSTSATPAPPAPTIETRLAAAEQKIQNLEALHLAMMCQVNLVSSDDNRIPALEERLKTLESSDST